MESCLVVNWLARSKKKTPHKNNNNNNNNQKQQQQQQTTTTKQHKKTEFVQWLNLWTKSQQCSWKGEREMNHYTTEWIIHPPLFFFKKKKNVETSIGLWASSTFSLSLFLLHDRSETLLVLNSLSWSDKLIESKADTKVFPVGPCACVCVRACARERARACVCVLSRLKIILLSRPRNYTVAFWHTS